MVTFRVPTDTSRKAFFTMRANVVMQLVDSLRVEREEARRIEKEVLYSRGHNHIDTYLDVVLDYFSSMLSGREPFQSPERCEALHTSSAAVSDAKLREFFKVETNDLVSGNKVMSRCSRCKSTEIFSNAVQTRSADEGMTLISTCERCLYSWRE